MHLTGIKIALAEVQNNDGIKLFMYFRLAEYLSDALDTLRPPAPPEGVPLSELGAWLHAHHKI